jgi:hypothetical protein
MYIPAKSETEPATARLMRHNNTNFITAMLVQMFKQNSVNLRCFGWRIFQSKSDQCGVQQETYRISHKGVD